VGTYKFPDIPTPPATINAPVVVLVDAVAEEGLQFIPTHPELFQVRTFFLAVIALGDFVLTNRQAIPIKQHRRLESEK
jgi:hypothetical protein